MKIIEAVNESSSPMNKLFGELRAGLSKMRRSKAKSKSIEGVFEVSRTMSKAARTNKAQYSEMFVPYYLEELLAIVDSKFLEITIYGPRTIIELTRDVMGDEIESDLTEAQFKHLSVSGEIELEDGGMFYYMTTDDLDEAASHGSDAMDVFDEPGVGEQIVKNAEGVIENHFDSFPFMYAVVDKEGIFEDYAEALMRAAFEPTAGMPFMTYTGELDNLDEDFILWSGDAKKIALSKYLPDITREVRKRIEAMLRKAKSGQLS